MPDSMQIRLSFYSYFKELAGCAETVEQVAEDSTLGALKTAVLARFPRLRAFENSMLVAVGVDYQDPGYVLKPEDQVALFPPVQGG
jgi:molybdopterin converting factor small subunit